MNQDNEKYHQQILFDEVEISDNTAKENTPQIIFDNQDWLAEQQPVERFEQSVPEEHKPKWLWRGIAVVFLGLVSVELVQFFIEGFSNSPVIAAMYAALLAGLSVVVGRSIWRELSGLRQYRKQQDIQQKIQAVLKQESQLDAVSLCESISKNLPCDLNEQKNISWQNLKLEEYNDTEIVQLYSRHVLSQVDQKALAEVAKFSTESVVFIALSPLAVVDMMIMLWRNLRMVNKIAALYGLKLGYWSRIKLIKQVVVNMAYAGASELVVDFGADLISADMLGKLSSRMAQGLGAGMLTARLGLRAMQMCRPIPFDEDTPKLKQVRKQIIKQVTSLMNSKA